MQNSKFFQLALIITITLVGILLYPSGNSNAWILEEKMNESFKNAETIEDYRQFIATYKPNELAFVAVQILAQPYLDKKDWQGAITVFQQYQIDFPTMQERFNKIIALLSEPGKNLKVKNLDTGVNTTDGEYCPVISADANKLYFVRSRNKLVFQDDQLKYKKDEDIYVSAYIATTDSEYWGKAEYLGEPISTSSPEAPMGISADGNTLLLFGNYPGSLGRGDIFYTEKTASGWSSVNHYDEPVNSEYFDCDAMITADQKAIVFISDRPGGIGDYHQKDNEFYHGWYGGNTDIYVSIKTDTGWTGPINLGAKINTPFCERTPFLHPDGKTLYFSSDGHYGLGILDVFKTTRLSDTSWTEWSEPINLGKEFNSPHIDWCYRIATAGDVAYFSVNNKNSDGEDYDIYTIELDTTHKPLAVTTVSGKVTDPSGNPLDVEMKWNDLTLNKEAGKASSDPGTGDYFIVLPAGHRYSYYAEKEGYIGQTEYLDLTDKAQYTTYTLNIILYPLDLVQEKDLTLKLVIFFDFDSFQLRPDSFSELDRYKDLLRKNTKLVAEIYGHTDDKGSDEYNQILSERRARAVVNYLVDRGIAKKRLTSRGFGKRQPINTSDTEDGRQKNRRVEIKLTESRNMKDLAEK